MLAPRRRTGDGRVSCCARERHAAARSNSTSAAEVADRVTSPTQAPAPRPVRSKQPSSAAAAAPAAGAGAPSVSCVTPREQRDGGRRHAHAADSPKGPVCSRVLCACAFGPRVRGRRVRGHCEEESAQQARGVCVRLPHHLTPFRCNLPARDVTPFPPQPPARPCADPRRHRQLLEQYKEKLKRSDASLRASPRGQPSAQAATPRGSAPSTPRQVARPGKPRAIARISSLN